MNTDDSNISRVPTIRLTNDIVDDDDGGDDDNNTVVQCGNFIYELTPKTFLFFSCIAVFLQGFVSSGLISTSVAAIERRYGLDATEIGMIETSFHISAAVYLIAMSYYGGRGHRPKWIGVSMTAFAFGAFMYAMPYFVGGKYSFSGRVDNQEICSISNVVFAESCSSSDLYWFFIVGQVFMAFATTSLYSLVPSYLDRNIVPEKFPRYLSIYYTCAIVGAAAGFVVGGMLLEVWVDWGESEPPGMDSKSPDWVGMWWIGFIISSFLALISSVGVYVHPKNFKKVERLPSIVTESTFYVQRDGDSKLLMMLKSLSKNPIFVFTVLANGVEGFTIAGFGFFMVKVVKSLFSLTDAVASLYVGFCVVFGASTGTYFGGWLMQKLRPRGAKVARLNLILAVLGAVFMPVVLLGCSEGNIVGVNTAYESDAGVSLYSACNSGCNCHRQRYSPSCGSNDLQYFSPCFAGCTTRTSDDAYSNCGCINDAMKVTESRKCGEGECTIIYVFLIGIFVTMFFIFTQSVPSTQVCLRSIPLHHRAVGLGIRDIVWRVIGAVPGPIVFGVFIDKACIFWDIKCGEESSCLEYDNLKLRTTLLLLSVLPKLASVACYALVYYFYNSWENRSDNNNNNNNKTASSTSQI